MSKIKGTSAERELIKLFWEAGWAAIRAAGSGSMRYPSPDILAGNKIKRYAVEVKSTKNTKKYFSKQDIKQLLNFADYFGAEPWLAIKFGRDWAFVNPEDLLATAKGYVISKESLSCLSFKELTNA